MKFLTETLVYYFVYRLFNSLFPLMFLVVLVGVVLGAIQGNYSLEGALIILLSTSVVGLVFAWRHWTNQWEGQVILKHAEGASYDESEGVTSGYGIQRQSDRKEHIPTYTIRVKPETLPKGMSRKEKLSGGIIEKKVSKREFKRITPGDYVVKKRGSHMIEIKEK